jgi:hypothetical protein
MLLFVAARTTTAAEYIRQEAPAPASAGELETAIDVAFRDEPVSERFLMKRLRRHLDTLPAFFRDSRLNLASRIYEFDRRNSSADKREALTTGGRLEYESGWWNNLRVRAGWYGSWKIDTRDDDGDTGLLAPGQEDIQVWGEARLTYRFTATILEGSQLRLYRQKLDLPYINKHDIRMLPATHEGYLLAREDSGFDYVGGHLTKIKSFDSERFIHMSRAAGAGGSDKGITVIGARPINNDTWTLGAISYYGWDTFNTFYAEASYHTVVRGNLDCRLSGQFTDQRSVGDELLGDFDTQHTALQTAFGWRGAVLKLAGSVTTDESRIRKPWGGSPTYLGLQRFDFDRANEKAVLLGFSYNTEFFSSLGLSSFLNIAHGTDAEVPTTGAELPHITEYDITIDYKPPGGRLQDLWVRARAAFADIEDDGETVRDYRLIINYSVPFL